MVLLAIVCSNATLHLRSVPMLRCTSTLVSAAKLHEHSRCHLGAAARHTLPMERRCEFWLSPPCGGMALVIRTGLHHRSSSMADVVHCAHCRQEGALQPKSVPRGEAAELASQVAHLERQVHPLACCMSWPSPRAEGRVRVGKCFAALTPLPQTTPDVLLRCWTRSAACTGDARWRRWLYYNADPDRYL